MKQTLYIFIAMAVLPACAGLARHANRFPAEADGKIYQIHAREFMNVSNMEPQDRRPLLSVSSTDSYMPRLLTARQCLLVRESDFENLTMRIVFFTQPPVVICGTNKSRKDPPCLPAHYSFDAGSSHGAAGELVQKISQDNSDMPVIVKRRDGPFGGGNCFLFHEQGYKL